jgi:hypothetical protein
VNGLAGDIPATRTAQITHHRRNIFGFAPLAGNGAVSEVVGWILR